MKLQKLFMHRSINLGMVTILGLFCYMPAAQAGSGSIIGDEDSSYIEKAVTGDFNADGTLDVVVCSGYTDQRSEPADDCIPEDPDDASDPTDPVSEGSDPDDPECDGVVEKVDVGAVHIFTSGVGYQTPISAADGVIYGKAEGDHFGRSCANAGDFNGDGADDLVVGAHVNNDGGTYAGAVYVIFGSPDILDIVNVEDARVLTILGANDSDYLGTAVASVGDSDGDGKGDIIIAAIGTTTGSAYLVFGGSSTRTLNLGLLGLHVESTGPFSLILTPRYVEYYGEDRRDLTASAVAGIGDVNGDGYADFSVGAPQNDDVDTDAGKVYILLGGSRPSVSRLSLEQRAAAQLTGEASYDSAGEAIAGAGDIDGDGYADVVIGASSYDWGDTYAGAAYVWYGSADPADGSLADTQRFIGGSYGDKAGSAVAGVGDFDGDGLDDLLVGAADGGDGGSAWLVFGSDAYDSTSMTLATGTAGIQKFTNPSSSSDDFGDFVGPAGDLDGNGSTYVIIGAPYNDDGGSSAGKIYIRNQARITK